MNVPTYTIVALIALVVAGGIIAWLGDVIGYRLGKRRSSLFGLRPRTTARAVGIAVGAILPLIGLGMAASGSSYVQDALFNIQHLRDRQEDLGEQVRELSDTKNETERDAQKARTEASEARHEAEGARSERDRLEDERTQAKKALSGARADLGEVQSQNDRLKDRQETLRGQAYSLGLEVDKRQRDLDDLARQFEPVQEELEAKKKHVAALQTEVDELEEILKGWKDAFYGPVLYEAGHELVRNVIRSGQTPEQIETTLLESVVLASKIARASGIAVKEGRSVQVLAPIPEDMHLGDIPEERIVRAVARVIQSAEQDSYIVSIKVLATVFAAQPEPEPVPVMLLATPNTRIYAQGETIVHTRIDGGGPRDQVFAQIWAILSRLRHEAQEQGVLPHPETGQYGDVPAEELLAAHDQLLSAGETQTVRAIAAEDVYRAGMQPFLVTIEVGEDSGA